MGVSWVSRTQTGCGESIKYAKRVWVHGCSQAGRTFQHLDKWEAPWGFLGSVSETRSGQNSLFHKFCRETRWENRDGPINSHFICPHIFEFQYSASCPHLCFAHCLICSRCCLCFILPTGYPALVSALHSSQLPAIDGIWYCRWGKENDLAGTLQGEDAKNSRGQGAWQSRRVRNSSMVSEESCRFTASWLL